MCCFWDGPAPAGKGAAQGGVSKRWAGGAVSGAHSDIRTGQGGMFGIRRAAVLLFLAGCFVRSVPAGHPALPCPPVVACTRYLHRPPAFWTHPPWAAPLPADAGPGCGGVGVRADGNGPIRTDEDPRRRGGGGMRAGGDGPIRGDEDPRRRGGMGDGAGGNGKFFLE